MTDLHPRRFYLLKHRASKKVGDIGRASYWQGKQDSEAGSLLPSSFPFLAKLQEARYFAREDLVGADEDELIEAVGFGTKEAKAVLTALAKLTG
jgi:hypothetical protein